VQKILKEIMFGLGILALAVAMGAAIGYFFGG